MSDRNLLIRSAALLLLALTGMHQAALGAPNEPGTWRCGSNSYSDQPCANGKEIDARDDRTPTDRRTAESAAQRTRTQADRMERERLRSEASAAKNAGIAVIGKAPPVSSAAPPMASAKPTQRKRRGTAKEAEFFTARGASAVAVAPAAPSGPRTPAARRP